MVKYSAKMYQQILGMSIRQFALKVGRPYETVLHHCKSGFCKLDKRMKGSKHHPLYKCYRDMLTRCYNSSHKNYHRYGGRGVRVSPKWFYSFEEFVNDMEKTYKPGLSLDRIDNSGNYQKDNCRWATYSEQSWNTDTASRLPGLKCTGRGSWYTEFMSEGKIYRTKTSSNLEVAVRRWHTLCIKFGKPVNNTGYETWLREAKNVRW